MNITQEKIDELNSVIKVDIVAEDYQDKVDTILKDYRKKANIPGFRKGHVPLGMIKKQYGKSIMIDEVNKLLQENLNKYLTDENLEVLGNPLPRFQENFSWDTDEFSFEFEIGLAPKFEVDFKNIKMKVTEYNVEITDEFIDKEIENIRSAYGKMSVLEEITENANIAGTLINEEENIEKKTAFKTINIKGKTNLKKFLGKKVGDVIQLKTKNLFKDNIILAKTMEITEEEAKELNIPVSFKVDAITVTELADLDKELFDKLFEDKGVNTVTELKNRLKLSAEKQFKTQSDQNLLNTITADLVETVEFDLPEKFIQKWLQNSGEEELSEEEAAEKFKEAEKGLRYQLIEGRLMRDNEITADSMEVIDHAKKLIKAQLEEYNNEVPTEEELNMIVGKHLTNKEEYERLHTQILSEKLLNFFKENISIKTEKITHEEFIKKVYSINTDKA